MGVESNIGVNKFPKQGTYLNQKVRVCFNYDTSESIEGTIIRDDAESPNLTIINLDNGKTILSTECQYQLI